MTAFAVLVPAGSLQKSFPWDKYSVWPQLHPTTVGCPWDECAKLFGILVNGYPGRERWDALGSVM